MWGYKPIPGARTPDDEKATLDEWARQQDATAYLRFSTADAAGSDPHNNTEAVGDIDAVAATTLGLKNIERVADMLLPATTTTAGDPYDELAEVYGRLLGQWRLEMGHVTQLVGGFSSQQKHIGQDGVRFTPIPAAKQSEAVQFLLANGFQTPSMFVEPELLRRMEPIGVMDRVRTAQNSLMNSLLQVARLERLIEQSALDPENAYAPLDFLGELRTGIWSELALLRQAIDPFRRNTQRVYLDTIDNRLNGGSTPPGGEVRALLKGELRTLRGQIAAALPAVGDRATRLHLEDSIEMIDQILDPRAMRVRPEAAAGGGRGGLVEAGYGESINRSIFGFDYDNDPFLATPDICWPDYVIR
jgi:hypothetical protein